MLEGRKNEVFFFKKNLVSFSRSGVRPFKSSPYINQKKLWDRKAAMVQRRNPPPLENWLNFKLSNTSAARYFAIRTYLLRTGKKALLNPGVPSGFFLEGGGEGRRLGIIKKLCEDDTHLAFARKKRRQKSPSSGRTWLIIIF